MSYARLSDEADQAKVDAEKLSEILEYENQVFEKLNLKDLKVKTGDIDIIFPKLNA